MYENHFAAPRSLFEISQVSGRTDASITLLLFPRCLVFPKQHDTNIVKIRKKKLKHEFYFTTCRNATDNHK